MAGFGFYVSCHFVWQDFDETFEVLPTVNIINKSLKVEIMIKVRGAKGTD